VRDIRRNFPRIMAWIEGGEQVVVTVRGKKVTRLVPEKESETAKPNFRARFGKGAQKGGELANSAVTLLAGARGE